MSRAESRPMAGERAWVLPGTARRVLLLAPPLALAALEILHPQPDETVRALMDASTWFAGFHVIQPALTGLVGLSVLLLADSFGRANAWVTRLGVGIFLVFFSAYESARACPRVLSLMYPSRTRAVFAVSATDDNPGAEQWSP